MDLDGMKAIRPDRLYKGQAYWCSGGPYSLEQAGGRLRVVTDWLTFCAECGTPFEFAKWDDSGPWLTRRCPEHSNGKPVR